MGRFVGLFLIVAIGAFSLETNLIKPADLRKRVQMKHLSDFSHWPSYVRTPDFVLKMDETSDQPSLHGRDSGGRPWQVDLGAASRGAWQSDAGGARTYYIAGYTGGAGMAPETWILALTFDDRHRPVPFFSITHGSYDAQGVEDVLDLDGPALSFLSSGISGA